MQLKPGVDWVKWRFMRDVASGIYWGGTNSVLEKIRVRRCSLVNKGVA